MRLDIIHYVILQIEVLTYIDFPKFLFGCISYDKKGKVFNKSHIVTMFQVFEFVQCKLYGSYVSFNVYTSLWLYFQHFCDI